MIVVDTSILAHFVVDGDRTQSVLQVRERDADWVAPILWRSELCNVLVTQVRAKRVSLANALAHFRAADKAMRGMGYRLEPDRVMALAAEHGLTAYDAEFAALASELGVPLITTDRALLRALPDIARLPEDFAS